MEWLANDKLNKSSSNGYPHAIKTYALAEAYAMTGVSILEDAMNHPENPEYHDINVKVTGYSSHFVTMDKKFQKEFIERVNYKNL